MQGPVPETKSTPPSSNAMPLYDRKAHSPHESQTLGSIDKANVKRVYGRLLPLGDGKHAKGTGIETKDGKTLLILADTNVVARLLGYKEPVAPEG